MATVEELERQLAEAKDRQSQLDERAKRFEAQAVDFEKQLQQFKGVDLEALRAAAEENEILKRQGQGVDEAKFQEAVEEKIKKVRQEWQSKFDAVESSKKQLEEKLHEHEVVGAAYSILGTKVKEDMAPFIKDVLRASLRKEGDQIVAYSGKEKLYSKQDVSKEMALNEYCGLLAEKYPSAFRESVPSGTMSKGERIQGTGAVDLVAKLRDPELAKGLSAKERLEAGMQIAAQHRRL